MSGLEITGNRTGMTKAMRVVGLTRDQAVAADLGSFCDRRPLEDPPRIELSPWRVATMLTKTSRLVSTPFFQA